MTRYASFDANIRDAPAPVTGWYDTEELDYGDNLPPPNTLLEMTDQQWDARLTGLWAISNGDALVSYTPPAPPPSADQALAQKVALGIAITSTSTPELACTMALDATTMDQIGSVARDVSSGLGLPGGGSSFTYPDIGGVPRSFNETQVVALYKAQRDLLLQLNTQAAVMRQGGIPNWPAQQSATIP